MGIQDRKVLACIGRMLKAKIDGEGTPTQGVPQGAYAKLRISPLLQTIIEYR